MFLWLLALCRVNSYSLCFFVSAMFSFLQKVNRMGGSDSILGAEIIRRKQSFCGECFSARLVVSFLTIHLLFALKERYRADGCGARQEPECGEIGTSIDGRTGLRCDCRLLGSSSSQSFLLASGTSVFRFNVCITEGVTHNATSF